MRIRFNGMFAVQSKKGGCACHGSVSGRVFITHKSFVLPSGNTRSFRVGEEYDVPDIDGNFLLSYSQTDRDGIRQDSFTKVE